LDIPLGLQGIVAPALTSSVVTRENRMDPVSPEERGWWMSGHDSAMAGSIARFLRSTQRAVASLRSPSSQTGYSELSKESSTPSPQKFPKRIRDSPLDLKDALDRSVFGESVSLSSSIQRPRVLSAHASVNEFVGLSANAGFFRPANDPEIPDTWADSASSPRSREPPALQNPERDQKGPGSEVRRPAYEQEGNAKMQTTPTAPVIPNARSTSPQVVALDNGHTYTHSTCRSVLTNSLRDNLCTTISLHIRKNVVFGETCGRLNQAASPSKFKKRKICRRLRFRVALLRVLHHRPLQVAQQIDHCGKISCLLSPRAPDYKR
jgi:hypothetical protein